MAGDGAVLGWWELDQEEDEGVEVGLLELREEGADLVPTAFGEGGPEVAENGAESFVDEGAFGMDIEGADFGEGLVIGCEDGGVVDDFPELGAVEVGRGGGEEAVDALVGEGVGGFEGGSEAEDVAEAVVAGGGEGVAGVGVQ